MTFVERALYKSMLALSFCAIVFIVSLSCQSAFATPNGIGRIEGMVLDARTRIAIQFARVSVGDRLTITDSLGTFVIDSVIAGAYVIRVVHPYFNTYEAPSQVVYAGRTATVVVSLTSVLYYAKTVTVEETAHSPVALAPVEMNREDIRRSAVLVSDVARSLMNLPFVVAAEDKLTTFAVRGGAPAETGFYVDGLFTPNLTHFPVAGSTGGELFLLNAELVQNLSLFASGFDASYGDRMTAIARLSLREGNRHQWQGQADLNVTGLSGFAEGPLLKNVTLFVSVRRSWLDILIAMLDVGRVPNFQDANAKLVIDFNDRHKVSLLSVVGTGDFNRTQDQALQGDEPLYGAENSTVSLSGVSWQAVWSNQASTHTALSVATSLVDRRWQQASNNAFDASFKWFEKVANFRSVTTISLDSKNLLMVGTEVRNTQQDFSTDSSASTSTLPWIALFAGVEGRVGTWPISYNASLRHTYSPRAKPGFPDPRLLITWYVSDDFSVSYFTGIATQYLPLIARIQNQPSPATSLSNILGVSYSMSHTLALNADVYRRDYFVVPVTDKAQLFAFDAPGDNVPAYVVSEAGATMGGESTGLDVVLRRRSLTGLQGMAGMSFSLSNYRDTNGSLRRRQFDVRHSFTLQVGYASHNDWLFTVRAAYYGSRPAIPVDEKSSLAFGSTRKDFLRAGEVTLPPYHSASIRVERRWFLSAVTITSFLNISNVYNRYNSRDVIWDAGQDNIAIEPMWGIIPVFGVSVDF